MRLENILEWVSCSTPLVLSKSDDYCPTRDVFQGRLSSLPLKAIESGVTEDRAYLLTAVAGEIGNNSFDHNLGQWRDVPGVLFLHGPCEKGYEVVLADRGQGVLNSLRRVRPDLKNDIDALRVAFTEHVSGRAPEKRGNGLKFVNEAVMSNTLYFLFSSGRAIFRSGGALGAIEPGEATVMGCAAVVRA
jgi:hypothetical protein